MKFRETFAHTMLEATRGATWRVWSHYVVIRFSSSGWQRYNALRQRYLFQSSGDYICLKHAIIFMHSWDG